MIELDAIVTADGLDDRWTWETVPELSLRYDCFIGDVSLVIDDVDLSARWGWVPVLDFAVGLNALVGGLSPGGSGCFEFTESDAVVECRRMGDFVEVSTNYSSGKACVAFAELRDAVREYMRRLAEDLYREHPDLGSNGDFLRIVRQI